MAALIGGVDLITGIHSKVMTSLPICIYIHSHINGGVTFHTLPIMIIAPTGVYKELPTAAIQLLANVSSLQRVSSVLHLGVPPAGVRRARAANSRHHQRVK